jgi:inorganic triphosphatase YgiF
MICREHTENEIKLLNLCADNRLSYEDDPRKTTEMLLKLLNGLGIDYGKISFKEHTDRYYDDDNGTLFRNNSGIRERRKGESTEITLKTPSSSTKESIGFRRMERECDIAEDDDILERMQTLLSDAGLQEITLNKEFAVEVRTQRLKIMINADETECELCFDKLRFYRDGKESGPQYEIEIEAIDADVGTAKIEKLTGSLISEFGFTLSEKSKYERGREWTEQNGPIVP